MRGKEGSIIVTIAISLFLVLAVLSPICYSASEGEETVETSAGGSDEIAYVTHAPIRINSNADFDAAHGVVNWATGEGNLGNPWIIEGLDINGTGYGYCIYVGNTSEYFTISESNLYGADGLGVLPYFPDSGVALFNVTQGNISRNVFNKNDFGINMISISNVSVIDNDIRFSAEYGISCSSIFFSQSSRDNTFTNNRIENNNKGLIVFASENLINNNIISNNSEGVTIKDNNTVSHNTIYQNNGTGINIQGDYNLIFKNNVSKNYYGVFSNIGNNNKLNDNIIYENTIDGIYLGNGFNQIITNNTVFQNQQYGINLKNSTNNLIINNLISNNTRRGIFINDGGDNFIGNNTIIKTQESGITIWSSNNHISGNNISEVPIGIDCSDSYNNISNNFIYNTSNGIMSYNFNNITNNNIQSSVKGILLWGSKNKILNNFLGDCLYGVYIDHESDYNELKQNEMNDGGIYLHFNSGHHQTIDDSNTVDGRPILYLHDIYSGTFSGDYGQVLLQRSQYLTITEMNLTSVFGAMQVRESIGIEIFNNTFASSQLGADIHSCDAIIYNNTFSNNHLGLKISSYRGYPDNKPNEVYHNTFVDNDIQAEDHSRIPLRTIWDNGYPSGGNYWSDYSGDDKYSGPVQNATGRDWIGDTPYDIDTNANDNYPLMMPYGFDLVPPEIISTSPVNNSKNVSINSEITIEFSESMYPASVEGAISISHLSNISAIRFDWSVDNATLTVNISQPFEQETTYEVRIHTDSKDWAGNRLPSNKTFFFTTWLDTDNDGLPDYLDPDDDNDNITDDLDAFPLDSTETLDTDGDGIGNNADPDDDNDGVPDEEDQDPADPEIGRLTSTNYWQYIFLLFIIFIVVIAIFLFLRKSEPPKLTEEVDDNISKIDDIQIE